MLGISMSIDATSAYLLSVQSRIMDHINTSKVLTLPGMFPTKAKYTGFAYGSMSMTKEDLEELWNNDPELMKRYEDAPSVFKKIEEADNGTVCLLIWPESLWHWRDLFTDISKELSQASQ